MVVDASTHQSIELAGGQCLLGDELVGDTLDQDPVSAD
jgi:hypothetical protein